MTQDEHEWGRLYNKKEEEARMWEGIRRETREKALKEGIEKAKISDAKEMIKNGIDKSMVSKCTGLTIEQIESCTEEV